MLFFGILRNLCKGVIEVKVVYKKTNLRVRLQSSMTFMWSNCTAPEMAVKLDLLCPLSGQLGEGQLCDVDPPPILLPVHPVMG